MPEAGRVITGSAKGVRLLAAGEGTRPLADRVKQALFATLESELGQAWPGPFLDLFAGTGAAGIEALSRGAPSAVFVERDPRAARTITENLRRARLDGGRVVRQDVLRFLASDDGRRSDVPFVAALLDPPYGDPGIVRALEMLGDPPAGWLSADAVVAAKHFWRDRPPATAGDLQALRERRFGETAVTFYVRKGSPAAEPEP